MTRRLSDRISMKQVLLLTSEWLDWLNKQNVEKKESTDGDGGGAGEYTSILQTGKSGK